MASITIDRLRLAVISLSTVNSVTHAVHNPVIREMRAHRFSLDRARSAVNGASFNDLVLGLSSPASFVGNISHLFTGGALPEEKIAAVLLNPEMAVDRASWILDAMNDLTTLERFIYQMHALGGDERLALILSNNNFSGTTENELWSLPGKRTLLRKRVLAELRETVLARASLRISHVRSDSIPGLAQKLLGPATPPESASAVLLSFGSFYFKQRLLLSMSELDPGHEKTAAVVSCLDISEGQALCEGLPAGLIQSFMKIAGIHLSAELAIALSTKAKIPPLPKIEPSP